MLRNADFNRLLNLTSPEKIETFEAAVAQAARPILLGIQEPNQALKEGVQASHVAQVVAAVDNGTDPTRLRLETINTLPTKRTSREPALAPLLFHVLHKPEMTEADFLIARILCHHPRTDLTKTWQQKTVVTVASQRLSNVSDEMKHFLAIIIDEIKILKRTDKVAQEQSALQAQANGLLALSRRAQSEVQQVQTQCLNRPLDPDQDFAALRATMAQVNRIMTEAGLPIHAQPPSVEPMTAPDSAWHALLIATQAASQPIAPPTLPPQAAMLMQMPPIPSYATVPPQQYHEQLMAQLRWQEQVQHAQQQDLQRQLLLQQYMQQQLQPPPPAGYMPGYQAYQPLPQSQQPAMGPKLPDGPRYM